MLGKHGETCDFCSIIILKEFYCNKCKLLLVLENNRRSYWCSRCKKYTPKNEIETNEFLRLHRQKKKQDIKKLNKKLRDKRYKKRHPGKCREIKHRYREKYPEKIRKRDRDYYLNHKLPKRLYRYCNLDKIRSYQRKWCKKNRVRLNIKRREKRMILRKIKEALTFIFNDNNFR